MYEVNDAHFDLALVGCGNMGGALLRGYLAGTDGGRALVVDHRPQRAEAIVGRDARVSYAEDCTSLAEASARVTVLAVKPQGFSQLLPRLATTSCAQGLILSIAAGISADLIQRELPQARVVRGMPNTPALRRAGCTVLWSGPTASDADRAVCHDLFASVGAVAWVDEERLMDAATALSGGGPAYVFAFAEALARAGEIAGLPQHLALKLSLATITGAAAMLDGAGGGPAQLKAAVRSPAGTTDAALRIFENGEALNTLVGEAVQAAQVRAAQLEHDNRYP